MHISVLLLITRVAAIYLSHWSTCTAMMTSVREEAKRSSEFEALSLFQIVKNLVMLLATYVDSIKL